MSVGGFAGGMASAFQKALDREQQEKLEDKRNTQANLRQAAGFAHDLKLYSRKVRDEERKSLTNKVSLVIKISNLKKK